MNSSTEVIYFCLKTHIRQVSSFPLQAVIGDYDDAITNLNDGDVRRQLNLVADALRLSASLLRCSLKKKYQNCALINRP